ncbi:PaaI family thioesterase [Thermovibrio ammonificans]|jgi:acyl-coenzyme A thioesterase PaaI-like protein|uniref:Thioesterase superfamily protein n=1 Tax=Thermovibrio ammonificans (strain DSM 15698 / JCM 12110 / HB-1) TaxID=648996 RepID=E8T2D6_THEA1|nr:PaaI family thioesterase [Thermovibrio ammonificans]ADU97031.1 thioesterase superfamily protein [Thermovibrio ammonificans HB-1]
MDGRELRRDNYCFVCGPENPKGMHLKFEKRPDGVYARFSLPKYYQGYDGVIHGGIITLLLDEAMAYLQTYHERFLTGRLTVRFHKPLLVGEEVEVRAWIEKERGRTKVTKAVMEKTSGEKVAEAEALMFVVREKE